MSRPDEEELALQAARERAEADDLAGRKARLAVGPGGVTHPLEELAAEREAKPEVSSIEMPIYATSPSERVEHAEGIAPEALRPELPQAKVIVVPQVDRSRFQTDLSQRKQRELGLSEAKTAGGRTARFLVQPGVAEGPMADEPSLDEPIHDPNVGLSLTKASTTPRAPTEGRQDAPSAGSGRLIAIVAVAIAVVIVPLVYWIANLNAPSKTVGSAAVSDAARNAGPAVESSRPAIPPPMKTASETPSSTPSEMTPVRTAAPTVSVVPTHDARPQETHPEPPAVPSANATPSSKAAPSAVLPPALPPTAKPTASSTNNPNIF